MIKVAFSEKYLYDLPPGHRFPVKKYELVKGQLLYEHLIPSDQIIDPGLCPEEILLKVHTYGYYQSLINRTLRGKDEKRIGLPLHDMSLKKALSSVACTMRASDWALKEGAGMNIGGGTHHAYADHGEGFCFFNDMAVAAKYLIDQKIIDKVLILDLDVHQGNGTADIFREDSTVFTFSMHCGNNYPLHKESSDWDIDLPDGMGDQPYLVTLTKVLDTIFIRTQPDIVFYQAGVDVLRSDKLGKLKLTQYGARTRDLKVFTTCKFLGIPVVITLGGGYSTNIRDIVNAHVNTYKAACEVYYT